MEVAEEARKEGGGLHKGLVGDDGAARVCAVEGEERGVGPVRHFMVVHPLVHLRVERGVLEGQGGVELPGTLAAVVLLEVEVDGCGGEGEGED